MTNTKTKTADLEKIAALDKSNMLNLLLDFPLQCKAAQQIAKEAKILFAKRDFKQIVFAGLGGSAIGADLVRSYLYSESRIPIMVLREYDLPQYVNDATLVFISSYSGNTEETLSSYKQARAKGASIIALSSGGKLEELAGADKVTFIPVPKGLPPRCAFGYGSLIPLCALARLGLAEEVDGHIEEMTEILQDLRDKRLKPEIEGKDNIAGDIALKLVNKFTVIYSSSINFDIASVRMRGQLAENSKALASSHVFPEMNHNEIVGWQNPEGLLKDLAVVMLRDKYIHPRVQKRMDITAEIIKKEGVAVFEIWSCGKDLLSRIYSLVYIGDFISYYLALAYGIDPTPVDRVTYLKNKLAEKNT